MINKQTWGPAKINKGNLAKANKLVLDFLFPENIYCICCKDSIDPNRLSSLCDKCTDEILWINDNPFESTMDSFAFDHLFACNIYGYHTRIIVQHLKLNGDRYIAKPLASLMKDRLDLEFAEEYPYDFICYIPSSKEKEEMRGFNQGRLLAKYLSINTEIPVEKFLIKPFETGSMRLSNASERKTLLSGAFDINPKRKIPKGCKILLVDDVLTTGSTANEASILLKANGASLVDVLVFSSSSGERLYENH